MKKELFIFVLCIFSVLSAQKEKRNVPVNKGIFLSSSGNEVSFTFNRSGHEQMTNNSFFNKTRINDTDHAETQWSQNVTHSFAQPLRNVTKMINGN